MSRLPVSIRRPFFGVLLIVLSARTMTAQNGTEIGGAWNRADDGSWFQIGLTSFTATEEYDPSGERRDLFDDSSSFRDGNFGATDIELRGELGITDWLTGTASTEYKVAVRQAFHKPTGRDSTASASGLGDIWIGARFRLLPPESTVAASISLGWKAPLASYTQAIPLGTGVVDYEVMGAGGSWYRLGESIEGHAQLAAGYRLRNRGSDELRYLAETALRLSEALTLQGIVDGVASTADFDRIELPKEQGGGSLVFDQSFTRLSFSLLFLIDADTELTAGYSRVLAGRNTLAGSSITFGIAWFE